MLEQLLTLLRGRQVDRDKARQHLATQSQNEYTRLMAPHDTFVADMRAVKTPTLHIGVAKDSQGTSVPVHLPVSDAAAMTLIQGGTGTGKTTFATHLYRDLLMCQQPVGVLDCKAGFYEAAMRELAAFAYQLPDPSRQAFIQRITPVNPFGDHLIPLNVCAPLPWMNAEVQAYEIALVLTRLFDSSMSMQMENILRHLLLLLIESRLSLVEAPLVLADEAIRDVLVAKSTNREVQRFFRQTYPELHSRTITALRGRLESILLAENLRLMLGANTCIDLKQVLDQGNPLVIFLGKGMGIPEELVDVIGSLFLQLLFQAAYAAAPSRLPYQLIADEFFHLLDAPHLEKRFTTGLTSLRSFNFFLTLVMHTFSQVPMGLREALLGNCDLMALFRTSGRNASYAGEFLPDIDPQFIRDKIKQTGQFPTSRTDMATNRIENLERLPNRFCYWYDRRKSYRAIKVRVPDVTSPHSMIGITEREFTRFIRDNNITQGGVCLSKDELRDHILQREKSLNTLVRPPIRVSSQPPKPIASPPSPPVKPKRKPRIG